MFSRCKTDHGRSVWIFLSVIVGLTYSAFTYSAPPVGFKEIALNQDPGRPLNAALWYPASEQGQARLVADNPVFYGESVVLNGTPASGQYPLVLLSHGYGGTWRNQSWLAVELASHGYIVAAPNHPGTTALNRDAQQAAALWARPNDLSRVIDAVTADAALAGEVNRQKIAAIGHSLGGWTVLALAGGMFDTARFKKECRRYPVLNACTLVATLGLENHALEKSLEDPRIKAVVSLDAGLVRGFTPLSLAAVHLPVLIIAAGTDVGDMPVELESGYLKKAIPPASLTYVEIPDAMHFSFLQRCKPGAADILDGENQGEGILCKDGGTRSREEIHRQVAAIVTGFLASHLKADTQ